MSRGLPPLTWFRSFEAAARTLSFTSAAEQIGLTQSAVSQQVKSLELRLGVRLFLRQPRGLALTDEGRKLLPQVGAALETLTQAASLFGRDEDDHLLTIASSVSVAQWVITPSLSDFTQHHPNLKLRILSAVWPDDFNATHMDVEIRFGSYKQVGQGAQKLQPDRLIPLTSPRLHGPLDQLPLIETVGTSVGWDSWRSKIGPVGQSLLYADTYGMALQMAVQGCGVALVSECLAAHALAMGLVKRADENSIEGQEGYFLSVNKEIPEAVAFQHWLLNLLET